MADQLTNAAGALTGKGLPYTNEVLQRVADLQQAAITLVDAQRCDRGQHGGHVVVA